MSYTFTASPTSGASYAVSFIPQRAGIPQPQTETFSRASFRTKSGLVPDVNYRIQVVAVKGGLKSTAVTTDFLTLPDGELFVALPASVGTLQSFLCRVYSQSRLCMVNL